MSELVTPSELSKIALAHAAAQVFVEEGQKVVAEYRDKLDRGLRELHAQGMKVKLPVRIPGVDGEDVKIGEIAMSESTDSIQVTDEAALTEWLQVNHPSEVEHITRPRVAFLKKIRSVGKSAEAVPDWRSGEVSMPSPETGELSVVPGLRAVRGGRPVSVRATWSEGGREQARSLVTGDLSQLSMIESSEEPA